MRIARLHVLTCALVLLSVAALAVGCGEKSEPSPKQLEAAMGDVIAAQNRFGLDLYRRLAASTPDETVFISPLSIHVALTMAYNGAAGITAEEMGQVLQLGDLSRDGLNTAVRELLERYGAEDLGARLNVANALWYSQELTFYQEYIERMEEFYLATVSPLSFKSPGSETIVNDWVSRQTEGLIPVLFDSLDPETVMLIVNAVYFKGEWSEPFDPALTQPRPFHLPTGDVKQVPMMYKSGQVDYYQAEEFQAIRLPYGDEKRLAMYIFLPAEDRSLNEFAASLTYEDWQTWTAGFRSRLGQVWLPRVEISYKTRLAATLQALGMAAAFDPGRADFGEIHEPAPGQNVYISDVTHQAVLKVDEEGTEAAAATSVDFAVTSLPAYEFEFVADRPFFVAIRDEETGAVMFLGSVFDPAA